MIIKDIGYIINEAASIEFTGLTLNESAIPGFTDNNIIEEKNGKLIAEGILQVANEKNRNGRFYPSEELFPQLTAPRTTELLEAGYLRAELGHPLSNELVRQQTIDDKYTCAQFLKLWTVGDQVWGRFRGTNNAFGEAFDKDLRDGCKPAWSLRALGTIAMTPRGAEVKKLRVITWDQVIYPSHPSAYTHKLITENCNGICDSNKVDNDSKVISITNESVINYIKSESANLRYVKENFDIFYDSVEVNKKLNNVTLRTKEGDTLVINLESYIGDEIRNYASKMNGLLS